MSKPDPNPFQAPSGYENSDRPILQDIPLEPPNIPLILGKWTLICGICAAPSFLFGLMVSGQRPMEIAGMLGGILIFIVAYTIFESSKYGQMLTRRRLVRIVARVGYGIRILVSIVFPLGAAIDIPCGSLAISISNFVFQTTLGPDGDGFGNELLGFVWFCTTTVIQGTLLNIVLLVFLLLLYGIGLLFTAPEDR